MILTPIPRPQLAAALNRFAAQLDDRDGHAAFVRIHMTSSERATGDAAESAAVIPLLGREADEAEASLLGILWEASLGQPALASFLDQNWLEGLERSAALHFTQVFARLQRRGLTALRLLPD